MGDRPLKHLKILDFSTLLPGPYASMMMADMGASVLRVTSPTRPDMASLIPPFVDGQSVMHHFLHRGKKSIALDLKQDKSIEIIKDLIAEFDILLEQFRPGVMSKLGLGYDELKTINPSLIYCSLTGYGQSGPLGVKAGHDINYMALSGAASYTGRMGEKPLPLGLQVADIAGGSHHTVIGILAAVIERNRSRNGQHVDISMTDASFAMNALAGAVALATEDNPGPEETPLNGGSFYDYYACADGKYLSLGGLEPQFIQALSSVLERPDLIELVDITNHKKQQKLKAELSALFATKDREAWLKTFEGHDVCIEPVLSITEAAAHPQLIAREMVLTYNTKDGTTIKQAASPIKFSNSDQEKPAPAPKGDEDTETFIND